MFDYIRENELRDFRFFKMPHALFTEGIFEALSNDAKLLYGLLLDRMSLSAKNGWQDDTGKVFIHFKNAEICEKLHIGAQKAVKLLKELVNIGLIERIRIGLGKPDRIYVKLYQNVAIPEEKAETVERVETPETAIVPDDENHHSGISEIKTPEFPDSQLPQSNNKTNQFKQIKSNLSADTMDGMRLLIKENIDYDWFTECYADREKIGGSQEELDEIVELMTECACATQPIRIHGQPIAAEVVKSRFLKLGSDHIQYVFDCLAKVKTKIRNIKAYLITTLYNAPTTMGSYYSSLVRHDIFCTE